MSYIPAADLDDTSPAMLRDPVPARQIFVAFIVLAAAWFGWRHFFPDLAAQEPAHVVEATALVTDFRVNQATAHHRYVGQILLVHGKAHGVSVVGDSPVVSVGVMFTNVDCHLEQSAMEVAGRIERGKPIRVKGRGVADGAGVMLRPCVLL